MRRKICATSVHPSAKADAKSPWFFAFPLHFSEKNPPFPKTLPRFSPRLADGLAPTAGAQGKNFTSPRRKCAEMRTNSLFFYFCLLSMREKRAIFASKTCFINSAWQNLGASSPRSFAQRSAPTHSSPAYDASFRHPFAQCRLSGARPEHPCRHPGPASHFPARTTSRHGASVAHRQPLRAEQRPAHRHLRRIGRHPPLRRLPAAQLERRHRTL